MSSLAAPQAPLQSSSAVISSAVPSWSPGAPAGTGGTDDIPLQPSDSPQAGPSPSHSGEKRRKGGGGAGPANGRDGPVTKKVKVGARASIACETCRKRKVRCSGDYPVCTFCSQRGMTCAYDGHPDTNSYRPGGASRRPSSPQSTAHSSSFVPDFPSKEVLRDVVNTLFAHLAEEGIVNFFHRPTLGRSIDDESYSHEVMLGILALAGRFSDSLKALHGPANVTCARYASQALQLIRQTPDDTSLIRLHTHLLLALHDLTEREEQRGWLHLGQAIRMAQLLRLGFLDEDDPALSVQHSAPRNWKGESILTLPASGVPASPAPFSPETSTPTTAAIIEVEVKRRTWWSCFLVERLFCDGRSLSAVLRPRDVSTRLPCSDNEFITGKRISTARFGAAPPPWGSLKALDISVPSTGVCAGRSGSSASSHSTPMAGPARIAYNMGCGRAPDDPEADLYGQTMRVAELWSDVRTYIAGGGRNCDRRAPWSSESSFHNLDARLSAWDSGLPSHLQYSDANLTAHSMIGQGKLYGLMHSLYFASLVYLHRDYFPFVPPSDHSPDQGPVDGDPLWFPPDADPTPPSGWWQESARTCFRAAHTITNIFINLKSQGSELTNPFAGFAVLTAGTIHIQLSCHWPDHAIAESPHEYLASDTRILNNMRQHWSVADQWCQALNTNYALNSLIHASGLQTTITQPLHVVRSGVMKIFRTRDEEGSNGDPSPAEQRPADLTEVLKKKHDLFSKLRGAKHDTSPFTASNAKGPSPEGCASENNCEPGALPDTLATLPQLYSSGLSASSASMDTSLVADATTGSAAAADGVAAINSLFTDSAGFGPNTEEITLPMADWSALSMLAWGNGAGGLGGASWLTSWNN